MRLVQLARTIIALLGATTLLLGLIAAPSAAVSPWQMLQNAPDRDGFVIPVQRRTGPVYVPQAPARGPQFRPPDRPPTASPAPQQARPSRQPFAPLVRQQRPWTPSALLPRHGPPAVTTFRYGLPGITRTIRVTIRDPRNGQISTTIYRPRLATSPDNSVRRVASLPKIASNGGTRRAHDAAHTRRLGAFAGVAALASMSSGVTHSYGANRPATDNGAPPDRGVRSYGDSGRPPFKSHRLHRSVYVQPLHAAPVRASGVVLCGEST